MNEGLMGKRIAIAGNNDWHDMSSMIKKLGGTPVARPQESKLTLSTMHIQHELLRLIEDRSDWIIFTSRTGLEAIMKQGECMVIRSALIEIMNAAKVVAIGYKTFAMLKKMGITPIFVEDNSRIQGLVKNLNRFVYTGNKVTLQLEDKPSPLLIKFLEKKGSNVRQIIPYHQIPSEVQVSDLLCKEIFNGAVDAVCFTTAVQVRAFFLFVKNNDYYFPVKDCFKYKVLVVAVGKATAEALKEEGINRQLALEGKQTRENIMELGQYYQHKSTLLAY